MRHFFTKAIVCAGVMASALALNGMAVFAAQVDSVWTPGAKIDGMTLDNTWSEQTVSTDASYKAEFTDKIFTTTDESTGETLTTGKVAGQTCYRSSDKTGFTIITNGDNAKVKIYATRNNKSSGTYIKTVGSSTYTSSEYPIQVNRYDSETNGTIDAIELTIASAGSHAVAFANSGVELYKVVITDEASTKADYTLDVKDHITETSLTNYTVKDSTGNVITGTTNVYNLTEGRTYTVSCPNYVDETFTTGSNSSIYVGLISTTATNKTLSIDDISTTSGETSTEDEVVKGFLITAGIKNQDGKYIRVQNDGTVQFELTTKGKITFEGIRSPNSNVRQLVIKKDGNVITYFENANSDNTGSAFLDSGVYTICANANEPMQFKNVTIYGTLKDMELPSTVDITTTKSIAIPAVAYVDDTYYAIALIDPTVEGATVENGSVNLDVTVTVNGQEAVEVDEAYETVTINGTEYDATAFGGNSNQYVYGFNVDSSNVAGDVAEYIQANVTVAQTVAE